jgi:wyosine [tRNA(Phe)-imidazoG37] synthetase (radical SAM superfamily)
MDKIVEKLKELTDKELMSITTEINIAVITNDSDVVRLISETNNSKPDDVNLDTILRFGLKLSKEWMERYKVRTRKLGMACKTYKEMKNVKH